MQKAAMSMSGFSNSPLGKDPLRYYEGDPYRARQEAVPGHLRETVDRRFQNGIPMPPQMTYGKRDNREWYGGSPYPQKSDHSTTNHLSEQNSGYQSSGHLNNSPNIHTNSVYHPTGRPDSYSSPVYPTNVSHNSYTPARHPDMGYPGKRPVSSGHLSNGPPPGPTNQTSCPPPHENGYRDDQSCHHHPSPPSSVHKIHHPPTTTTSNGPQLTHREFWRPQDHIQGSPHPIHDGMQHSNFRPVHSDSSYSPQSSNYRSGPTEVSNYRPTDAPPPPLPHVLEGYWSNTGLPRQPGPPPIRPHTSWESSDSRTHPHSQRRMSDSNQWKGFINTAEERRHNHLPLDRCSAPYSPSLSSQSSWSPGFDESGSPRLRMPQPPPSTPDDTHGIQEPHTESYHRHHLQPQHVFGSSSFEKERGSRESTLLDAMKPSRIQNSRDERRALYSRGPNYHDRRGGAPVIINVLELGSDGGGQMVRDPRQAGFSRAKRIHHNVLQEHSYSRQYCRGCENHPGYNQIGPCTDLNPSFLTELKSSFTTTRTRVAAKTLTSDDSRQSFSTSSTESFQEMKSNESEKTESQSSPTNTGAMSLVSESSTVQSSVAPHSMALAAFRSTEREKQTLRQQMLVRKEAEVTKTYESSRRDQLTTSFQLAKGIQTEKNHLETDDRVGRSRDQTKKSDTSDDRKGKLPAQIETKNLPKRQGGKTGGDKVDSPASGDALCSLDGFHLDLDLEPTSGSNSTCCSESEEMTEGKNEHSDMEIEEEDEETGTGEDRMTVDAAETSSDDESQSLSCSGNVEKLKSPEKWSVCLPEPGKMRFSRLDNMEDTPDAERLSLKQMTSNRIQLRNGRVLPASSLAFLAASQKITSPPQRPTTVGEMSRSPPSSTTSGSSSSQNNRLRRSKRLAGATNEINNPHWTDSESLADQSFEMDEHMLSSDESEFDLPDFCPPPTKSCFPESPLYKPPSEGKAWRGGKRGCGRGRGSRRGGKKGGTPSTAGSPNTSGVKFYVHEPRTREEDGILKRRLELEMEVKRNEKIQSEHKIPTESRHHRNINTRDDDKGSVVSGSLPASSFSLDSLQTVSKTSSNSTEFSADLIARVKKISTARSSGDTPLHKCSRTGKFDMVRYLLLGENSPVNVQDNAGWTPLHEATSNGHTDIAELLLQHGADSNASARDGTRPIHDAIEIGCLDLVKLLIDHRADPMVEYGERTAIEFAKDHNQLEIADYIKDVIQSRQDTKKTNIAAAATGKGATHPQKPTHPTRSSKKDKLLKQVQEHMPRIPVNGYGPGCVSFGEELDLPLFFVSPIVELSSNPHLPVYNFQISPPGTINPRRHNFYLMDDLLTTLNMGEKEFIGECHEVNILELTVAEFLHRMKLPHYNVQISVPERIKSMPRKRAIKFVPLCHSLSQMLDIVTENLDN